MPAFERHFLLHEQLFASLHPAASAAGPEAVGASMIEPVVGCYLWLGFNAGRIVSALKTQEKAEGGFRASACTPSVSIARSWRSYEGIASSLR